MQKVMSFTKGQNKIPEKQLNEAEIGKFREKESRIIRAKMIQDLGKRMEAKIEKMQELFTKDLEELKDKQTEMNNTLEGIKRRITEAEEQINDLKGKMVEIIAPEQTV